MTEAPPTSPPVTPLPPLSVPAASGLAGYLRGIGLILFVAGLFVPGILLADDRYWLPLFTRYMALALFALSVDLIWGYTGLLSLGQGVYFGLGAYIAGYSLKLRSAASAAGKPFVAAPDMALPDFMEYCRLPAVPGWVAPLIDLRLALVLAVLVPTLVAGLFGLLVFWRRIKGVYFSLITQALLYAVFLLVVSQQPYTGGVVGMTNLAKLELFGQRFVMLPLYCLVTAVVGVAFLGCWWLVHSKFGQVLTAIRDSETRVLALGYNAGMYKTFVFALAGGLAGLAGALYVSAMGTAGPANLEIAFSIEVVIFVAVGGRGTLLGAILGAILVSLGNTYFSDEFKEGWPIILGALFILVVVFLPNGITGLFRSLAGRLHSRLAPAGTPSGGSANR
jgi:urea transport system permease protein